jgi:hypothetical protein
VLHNAAFRRYAVLFEHDRDGFFVLARKHFSEPADTAR